MMTIIVISASNKKPKRWKPDIRKRAKAERNCYTMMSRKVQSMRKLAGLLAADPQNALN